MSIYKDGTTAFTTSTAGVTSAATNPSPPAAGGSQSYWESTAAAGSPAVQRWDLDGGQGWQFRRCVYLDTAATTDVDLLAMRGGADATTNMIVRVQGTNKLRIAANGGTFPWTSTADFPLNAWYRLEGYGNAVNGTARVALFPIGSSTAVTGMDSGDISVPQGGSPPTGVRLGKCSNSSGYAGLIAWDLDEFYTGADSAASFLGPYTTAALALAGVVTPSTHTVGQEQTLTLTPSGGNGKPLSYAVTWDGTSLGPQTSNVFKHTDSSAGTKNWSATVTQNS